MLLGMDDANVQQQLVPQYLATMAMLKQAIEGCPEGLWLDSKFRNQFWHVAYHAIFSSHFERALIGVWVGLNRIRIPCVYRMVLSQIALTEIDLARFEKASWIDVNETGSGLIEMPTPRSVWNPPAWK